MAGSIFDQLASELPPFNRDPETTQQLPVAREAPDPTPWDLVRRLDALERRTTRTERTTMDALKNLSDQVVKLAAVATGVVHPALDTLAQRSGVPETDVQAQADAIEQIIVGLTAAVEAAVNGDVLPLPPPSSPSNPAPAPEPEPASDDSPTGAIPVVVAAAPDPTPAPEPDPTPAPGPAASLPPSAADVAAVGAQAPQLHIPRGPVPPTFDRG